MESVGGIFGRQMLNLVDWICESDYDAFTSQHSLGRVYHCVGVEENYIVIKSNRSDNYRVNPQGFNEVSSTDFYIGDKIKILSGSKAGSMGIILSMGWHSNKEKIIYSLEVDGKRRSKQYWEEDIEPYE